MLAIDGTSGGVVNLSNTSNGQSGVWSLGIDGAGTDTHTYVSGVDVLASLLIDDSMTINII